MVLLTACIAGVLLSLRGAASLAPYHNERAILPQAQSSRSCSVNSFTNVTNFVLKEYEIETIVDEANRTQLRGTLAVENPGSGDTYRLYHIPISVGGGVWSVCQAGKEAPLPPQLLRCQYVIERQYDRIGFRFQWYCDDKDPSRPLIFDATVIGELPAEVCVTRNGTDGVTQSCSLAASQVPLPIENIYWEASSQSTD